MDTGSYSFKAVLVRPEGIGTWTFLSIPLEVSGAFGSKGQVRLKGTINGYPFRSTALPMGDGTHYLVVGKAIRDQINAAQGDTVEVILELDQGERALDIPKSLEDALASHPQARIGYEKLSYSHKKAYIDWIQAAKKEMTRQVRIAKSIDLLAQGKKLR